MLDAERIKGVVASGIDPHNLMSRYFVLIRQSGIVMQQIRIGQPMRLSDRRILHILSGQAVYRINLMDHRLCQGDVLVLPPNTLIEVLSFTDDYAVEGLLVIDFPGIDYAWAKRILPIEVLHLSLDDDDHLRMGAYLHLIATQMKRAEYADSTVSYLVLSMVEDVKTLQQVFVSESTHRRLSRGAIIMSDFIALLRQYGTTQRNISFYAKQLTLTANHLSDVVRQQSGLSVMEWLHRTTVTEAKVLLKHSDLMNYEISERLNFAEPTAFNRYFKKQVGMTPLEYRESE